MIGFILIVCHHPIIKLFRIGAIKWLAGAASCVVVMKSRIPFHRRGACSPEVKNNASEADGASQRCRVPPDTARTNTGFPLRY